MTEITNLIKQLERLMRERNEYRTSAARAMLLLISQVTGRKVSGWGYYPEESLFDETRVQIGVDKNERCVVVLEPNASDPGKSRFVRLTADNFELLPEKVRATFSLQASKRNEA